MKTLDWYGCYADSWQGEIVPEAFSHPAKFARGLIGRIYEHCLERGYLKPGDVVGDPFGGVALGSIHAMLNGLHWRGVELEPKFVALGNQNLQFWRDRYGLLLRGTAVLIQGDSRNFARLVQGTTAVISSAPFGEAQTYGKAIVYANGDRIQDRAYSPENQGTTPGNLAHLPAKTADLDGVISSPPYVDAISNETSGIDWEKAGRPDRLKPSPNRQNGMTDGITKYGREPGNLGNDSEQSFWQAAAIIVSQVVQSLKPGGTAVWVCGDFVRKGDRVYFGKQWERLCNARGLETVEWITAWKQEPGPTQKGIFEDKDLSIDRVSFFRRLANEKNPDAAVLNEDVIVMRKV